MSWVAEPKASIFAVWWNPSGGQRSVPVRLGSHLRRSFGCRMSSRQGCVSLRASVALDRSSELTALCGPGAKAAGLRSTKPFGVSCEPVHSSRDTECSTRHDRPHVRRGWGSAHAGNRSAAVEPQLVIQARGQKPRAGVAGVALRGGGGSAIVSRREERRVVRAGDTQRGRVWLLTSVGSARDISLQPW